MGDWGHGLGNDRLMASPRLIDLLFMQTVWHACVASTRIVVPTAKRPNNQNIFSVKPDMQANKQCIFKGKAFAERSYVEIHQTIKYITHMYVHHHYHHHHNDVDG